MAVDLVRFWRRGKHPLMVRGRLVLLTVLIVAGGTGLPDMPEIQAAERFENVEIRVIRPRYFNKRKRIELGGQLAGIMNETFIYTFIASGPMTYHFSETIGLELGASLGVNIDKEDKRLLFDEFEIKTKIFRHAYSAHGAILWTPVYGKWQLPGGRLIYFDTFITVGGGMTGINWQYSDFCTEPDFTKNANATPVPADATLSYPTMIIGAGQRYFLSKKSAVRWDLRNNSLFYEKNDTECDPVNGDSGSDVHNNITLSLGVSKFF